MTVIVQQIVTEWSKASRGGDRAGRRNAVPDAAKLPPISDAVEVAVHSLSYDEVSGFRTPKTELSTNARLPLRIGCVQIRPLGDGLIVSFRYMYSCGGAPERGWIRKDIRLAPGEWARIQYNGRFSVEAYWFYRQTTLNIACATTLNPKIFTHTRPTVRFSAMGILK